jgi:hypothetical protein
MALCARLPWLVAQSEAEMLFFSWPVAPAAIAERIPAPLTLDLYEGRAWITLIPFRMERLRLRGLPPLPFGSRFLEVDCLTCVRAGSDPGIWFLRIDAATLLGAWVAPACFGLPYHDSRLSLEREGDWRRFRSLGRGTPAPELSLRYRPAGPGYTATEGTLAHFLVERFLMFSRTGRGTLLVGREARPPRLIHEAEVEVGRNTIPEAAGVPAPGAEISAWYCSVSDIRTWLPAPYPNSP